MAESMSERVERRKREDLKFMKEPNLWPMWPYLPMKRYPEKGSMETGVLMEEGVLMDVKDPPVPKTIYILNVWHEISPEDIDACKKYRYGSLEAILDDNWMVD